MADRALLLASVNLLHGVDVATGTVDTGAAARAVAALGADVVVLQEVDVGQPRSGGVDQVAVVAAAAGGESRFAPALAGDPDRRWVPAHAAPVDGPAYGVGVVSRWPVTAATAVALPGGGAGRRRPSASPGRPGFDREPRVALQVRLDVAGRALTVTTTHLSYLPWRGMAQLRTVLANAAQPGPALLAGDFNLPVRAVRAVARDWRHAGGTATYPAWRPRAQPDQVLARGAVALEPAWAGPALTSDHRPLLARLRLT